MMGYCTNVLAGRDYGRMLANLRDVLPRMKALARPAAAMGVGLWLSSEALAELMDDGAAASRAAGPKLAELRDWLSAEGLRVFTLNGFPYHDFHEPSVKHRVYQPDWADPRRLRYTLDLVHVARMLAPSLRELSISTLPLGWRGPATTAARRNQAALALARLAVQLGRLHDETGLMVHVDLEPEPGCVLGSASDVVEFFFNDLPPAAAIAGVGEDICRRHLRVCHDICHASVMFEDQAATLRAYAAAGISVGKVQISAAIRVPFDALSPADRRAAFAQLRAFAEPRYLHQTTIRTGDRDMRFFADLPEALATVRGDDQPQGEWRVHFHVPIFLDRFGLVQTTQGDIINCARAIQSDIAPPHLEIETYAWSVLPPDPRRGDLADGMAREWQWAEKVFAL